jgi:hypothetical protein
MNIQMRQFAFASLFCTVFTSAAAAGGSTPVADKVRAANERFHDVSAAVAEGYAPIPCASGQLQ